MDIKLETLINYSEVDAIIQRLMIAMTGSILGRVSADLAKGRIKSVYASRFKAQVNNNSYWQIAKNDTTGGLGGPNGQEGEPGFLTGTTFNSITSGFNGREGVVFLNGMWPQGVGAASRPSQMTEAEYGNDTSECSQSRGKPANNVFQWGEFAGKPGLEFYITPGYQMKIGSYYVDQKAINNFGGRGRAVAAPKYIEAEPLATKWYGPPDREIKWMYLDPTDVDFIVDGLNAFISEAMGDLSHGYDSQVSDEEYDELSSLFKRNRAKAKAMKKPMTANASSESAAPPPSGGGSDASGLEAQYGISVDDLMLRFGAATEKELIKRLEVYDELNPDWWR